MISVVMPVLDEAAGLRATLAALLAQPGEYEVIVVDGGSRDATCEIVAAHEQVRLLRAARGRAAQMNAGAAVARGDTLLFLHADTRLPAGAIARLEAAFRSGVRWQAGAFRHAFEPTDWRLRLVSWGNNLRCRRSRVYFGDQAIFVRTELFRRAGGFPEVPMLEDVMFCERIRGLAPTVLLPEAVQTDSRRLRHHGVWRSVWRGLRILLLHRLGLRPDGHGFGDPVR
ncbi:MAG TPA: TIGR04283 family arsenosugar biosynthesis glycosyltransferase [Ramlibacter sp.]|nr:TIGR04283 family arsenosugar biosynthesis glycosyltransferase [Ramlibacter sp.]